MLDYLLGWFVVAIPFLVSVGATVISLKLPHERHYWKFVWGSVGIGIVFSGLTALQQARSAAGARRDQTEAIEKTAKETAKQTTDNVAEATGEQYTALVDSLTTQVGELKAQLANQDKKVDAIGNSNIITGKSAMHVFVENPQSTPASAPATSSEGPHFSMSSSWVAVRSGIAAKNARQFVLTTPRNMNGGKASFICKGKGEIVAGDAAISGASVSSGGGILVGPHHFEVDIAFPNWSPDNPLLVTLYFNTDTVEPCEVTPHG